MAMIVTLPVPPSTNNRMTKGMRLTKEYRYWKVEASKLIEAVLEREPDDSRYAVTIYLYWGDKRRRDLDNFIKGPIDAVTESECVWLDDSQVDAIRVYREQGHRDEVRMEEGTMQIVIEDLSKADEMPF